MADDSWDVEEKTDFHPCDPPHGMKDYILNDLTKQQQHRLNIRKRNQIRADQMYLADHPEIRGLIIMILRALLKRRPKYEIYETIGLCFTKPSTDIKQEVEEYIEERQKLVGVSRTKLERPSKYEYSDTTFLESEITEEEEEEEGETKHVVSMELSELSRDKREKFGDLQILREDEEFSEMDLGDEKLLKDQKLKAEEEASVSSAVKDCQQLLEAIIDDVLEEVDVPSIASITSPGIPVDYEDHSMISRESSDDDDDDDDDEDD